MGILDLYSNFNGNQGSSYDYDAVSATTQPSLLGSTKQSKLHSNGSQPGYSLDGSDYNGVNAMNGSYNNEATPLPPPTILDLNGAQPSPPYTNPETGATYL